MAYYVKTYNHRISNYCKDIFEARYKAFGYIMSHKKDEIFIHEEKSGDVVGFVYWNKKKDKYGRVLGPCYWSDKTGKDYLLDLDGKIFDMKTDRKVPGQYRRR